MYFTRFHSSILAKCMEKKKQITDAKNKPISLAPLDFEQALENLLQVKPEKKTAPKKKSNARKTRKTRE